MNLLLITFQVDTFLKPFNFLKLNYIAAWRGMPHKSFLEIEDHFGGCEAKAISKRYCLRPDLLRQAELYRVEGRA